MTKKDLHEKIEESVRSLSAQGLDLTMIDILEVIDEYVAAEIERVRKEYQNGLAGKHEVINMGLNSSGRKV